ncbi:hypothetical protein NKJ16_03285 [Mesorhizobium sp. M0179]|uniref:hypothetical protein n=1 Tax=unclassified Mesorhizobium TaxID=325217 RepID=UPI0003CE622E|nr:MULTISPECIES: hypothetical protein [unclassified Mesorhizobium]ESX14965.1 hypothetical protein X768_01375 [Mesorhizobium sp. LSJC265A00]ESY06782.1 hypothetical protein X753_11710 [Mesorhizobium sp. LNJC399B00]WJI67914.1 hypothetical protein NLY36_24425 [Mesorhizobium sp. C399B]
MTVISCLSLVSPVGYSAGSTAAAMRANIAAFAELSYRDADGEPIRGASVDALPATMRGRDRVAALTRLAADQVDPKQADRLPWGEMPIILCTREPQFPGARLNGIVGGLALPNGASLVGPHSVHVTEGAVSTFVGIWHARKLLAERKVPACIIVAVDTLIDSRTLGWLDKAGRLKTSIVTDGLIPGEAASISVVSARPLLESHVTVHGLGLARETATVLNEEPFRADGLASALRTALAEARVEIHDVAFRLSDVAGESYAFEELVVAQMRVMRTVRPQQLVWLAAGCIGDCGAAAGSIQFAWAEQAFRRGYAPGPSAVLYGSSTFGGRAAAIVTA